jgi:glutamate synthase (NADPH/NADH) small chain
MPEADLRKQGARCMDCGIPFCHTGQLISGMASGCPIHNLIPEWNDLVYRGLWKEALERLHKTNNFPNSPAASVPLPAKAPACWASASARHHQKHRMHHRRQRLGGRLDHAPQAEKAHRQESGRGRFRPRGPVRRRPVEPRRPSRHRFERADRPGGLLMYGIPNMKLDKERLVLRRIRQMEEKASNSPADTEVGKNYPAEKLLKEFDAVILAPAPPSRATCPSKAATSRASISPWNSSGQHPEPARRTQGRPPSPPPARMSSSSAAATPAPIASAPPCATAARAWCNWKFCPSRPSERAKDNPWPEWPKVYKLDYGQEEAAAKFGADPRVYLTTAKKFEGDAHGQVKAVHTVQIEWQRNEKGQFIPKEVPGTEKIRPRNWCFWPWAFWDRNSRCWNAGRRARRPLQRQGRL